MSKSETIIGEPQKAGEATIIPVHRLKVAFGAASATAGAHRGKLGGDSGGHGAGGAVELDPVAAIAVGKDGHAHLLSVDADAGNTWAALLQEVPDLLAKLAHTLGDRVTHELSTRGVKAAELDNGEAPKQALPDRGKSNG
jgi:uncharacterized spore protein YtfJ